MALNESLDSFGFTEAIFANPDFHTRFRLEDFRQLSSFLRLVRLPTSQKPNLPKLLAKLDQTVNEMTQGEETTVSKFQQEVYDTIRQIIGARAIFNCQKHSIEKDIVLTHFDGEKIRQKGLVIEVDGVYHFPRNSEEQYGKGTIKLKVLKKLGYHVQSFGVPYYAWAILEQN